MTSAPATLAAARAAAHSTIPSPLTIVLVVAAVGYVLWSRMKGQPLQAKRLLVLPVVLTVLGITDLTGSSAPHLTPKDIGFLATAVGISAVLGAARGATIELYPHGGDLWQRYRPITVVLWITLIAAKLVETVIASAAGASAGGGTSSLLLSLGVSLLAEAAIVGPRALSTGLPFATDRQDSGSGQPGPSLSRPSPASGFPGMTPPPQHPASSRSGESPDQSAPPGSQGARGDAGLWRSPSLSDGVSWLRQQAGQPASTRWSQEAPSPGTADHGRGSHHDHHHDHHRHHGLTGPS